MMPVGGWLRRPLPRHHRRPRTCGRIYRADDIAELDRRICAVVDAYIQTDDERRDQPLHGGMFVLHRLAE